jgi:hypothetical protein
MSEPRDEKALWLTLVCEDTDQSFVTMVRNDTTLSLILDAMPRLVDGLKTITGLEWQARVGLGDSVEGPDPRD